jgi:hypothetical protein
MVDGRARVHESWTPHGFGAAKKKNAADAACRVRRRWGSTSRCRCACAYPGTCVRRVPCTEFERIAGVVQPCRCTPPELRRASCESEAICDSHAASLSKYTTLFRKSEAYSELWIGSFCSCTISTVQLPKCCPTSQVGVHLEDPSEIFLLQSRKLHVTGCRHAAHAPLWAIWSASIACHFNLRNPRNDVAGYVNPEWGNWLFAITPASRWRRTPSPSLPYSIPLFGMQEFFPWQAEIWCSKLQYVNPEWGNWLFSGFSCSNHENVKKKRTMEFSTPRFQNHTQMCTQSLQNKHAFPFFFGMCRRTLTKLTQ